MLFSQRSKGTEPSSRSTDLRPTALTFYKTP